MHLNRIKIRKLKIIKNSKGDILKYLSKKTESFSRFGEVYFNEIKKKETKGWNRHEICHCFLTVPVGKVKFTFAININSNKKTVTISKDNYSLIIVPPKIWFKFKSLVNLSLVVNTIDRVHDNKEVRKSSAN